MSRSLLLSCDAVSKAYGTRSLFEELSFGLFEGDQVGLVGANGSGKSTLLKILAGLESPDRGTRSLRGGIQLGYVAQDPELPSGLTVEETVAASLTAVEDDARPGRVAQALGRGGFPDGHAAVDSLSGGWRKRLAIACALASEPDVLLMDEPTNHLDVEGILWLEELLAERARAALFVSHDRYFLERMSSRVLELGRAYPGGLFESDGTYSEFLARREGPIHQGPGPHQGGGAAHGRALRDARTLRLRRRGHRACRLRAPHSPPPRRPRRDQVPRRPHDRARSESRPHPRPSPGPDGPERQRQDHRARSPRGLAPARRGRDRPRGGPASRALRAAPRRARPPAVAAPRPGAGRRSRHLPGA